MELETEAILSQEGSQEKERFSKGYRKFQQEYPKIASFIFWVIGLSLIIVLGILLRIFIFQTFYIESTSMMPTLNPNERLVVNKLTYSAHDINRGDIVIIDSQIAFPEVTNQPDIIKRVIGLPGEIVRIEDCKVYIDNRLLKEPYVATPRYPACINQVTILDTVIPEGEVFILGDNRGNSFDSRSFKSVTTDAVIGRAFVKIWPLWEIDSL